MERVDRNYAKKDNVVYYLIAYLFMRHLWKPHSKESVLVGQW